MRKVEFEVYTIDELTEESKKKAIDNYRDKNIEYLFDEVDGEMFIDSCMEQLRQDGINADNKEIYYSLSYSQGDGLCIVGDVSGEDIKAILNNGKNEEVLLRKLVDFAEIECNISHNSNYYHSGTMIFDFANTLYYRDFEDVKEFIINELEIPEDEVELEIEDLDDAIDYLDREIEDIMNYVKGYFIEKAEEFEHAGYKDIEYHYSNEYVYDYMYNNEIKLLKNGELF